MAVNAANDRLSIPARLHTRGYANRDAVWGNIFCDNGIRTDQGMLPNADIAQDASTGADIDMTLNVGQAASTFTRSDRDLLHDQAIGADPGLGMNDNTVGMRKHQTALDPAIKGNLGLRDDGPEPVLQDPPFLLDPGKR